MSTAADTLQPHPAAKTGLSLALWLFGLFTTMLLMGLWGRTVATDQATLEQSTRAVLESEIVNDRVALWVGEGLVAAEQLDADEKLALVARVQTAPEMQLAVQSLVDIVVGAALAPPGEDQLAIDVRDLLGPVLPIVSSELSAAGLTQGLDGLQAAVDELSPLVLATDRGLSPTTSMAHNAAAALSTVVVVALIGMVVTGAGALLLSVEPISQLRSLALRVALSAVTFAVILRVGSWVVDPNGGRSPLGAGGAVVLGSNTWILGATALAAVAAAGALNVWLWRRRVKTAAS